MQGRNTLYQHEVIVYFTSTTRTPYVFIWPPFKMHCINVVRCAHSQRIQGEQAVELARRWSSNHVVINHTNAIKATLFHVVQCLV
jgi:hypothetical protein